MPISAPLRTPPPEILVSTLSIPHGIGSEMVASAAGVAASATWPTSNRALYVPMYFPRGGIITKLWCLNGAAVSGNVDVGLWRPDNTKVISGGGVAQANTNVVQEFDVTDTAIGPGLYYLGVALDNTTGTLFRLAPGAVVCELAGMMQQSTAYPLPSPMVPVAVTTNYVPVAGLAFRTLAA